MTTGNRRAFLGQLGMAAAIAASGLPISAIAQTGAIIVPSGPFRLQRELERGLKGGQAVCVIREWDGRFLQDRNGLKAIGEQVSCVVSAPAVLEPIAEIERNRQDAGPFPAQIDRQGRIIKAGRAGGGADAAAAVAAAISILEQTGRSPGELEDAKRYLNRLARSADTVFADPPPDLFFPRPGRATDRRALALPDALTGEVRVTLEATARADGLLDRFERRIVTRIGDDVRPSHEIWTLRLL